MLRVSAIDRTQAYNYNNRYNNSSQTVSCPGLKPLASDSFMVTTVSDGMPLKKNHSLFGKVNRFLQGSN